MTFLTRNILPALLALGFLLPISEAFSQVVVYRIEFDDDSDAINYRPYFRGYYVAPATGGVGSILLQWISSSSERNYQTNEDFGQLFIAVDGSKKRMVLSATSTNQISSTSLLAIGQMDSTLKIEGDNFKTDIKVADKMEGSSLSADSERDLPFFGFGEDSGYAGISKIKVHLEKRRTDEANDEESTVAETLAELVTFVEGQGYTTIETATTPDAPRDGDVDTDVAESPALPDATREDENPQDLIDADELDSITSPSEDDNLSIPKDEDPFTPEDQDLLTPEDENIPTGLLDDASDVVMDGPPLIL